MCFENMYESSKRGELLCVDGGVCHWHLRRDGQLTIREIISTRPGAGSEMLTQLRQTAGAKFIIAKCPSIWRVIHGTPAWASCCRRLRRRKAGGGLTYGV